MSANLPIFGLNGPHILQKDAAAQLGSKRTKPWGGKHHARRQSGPFNQTAQFGGDIANGPFNLYNIIHKIYNTWI
jgi:hypothetical protein